jgi:hypothetical protein
MKTWLQDFPTQNAASATALLLILVTGTVVVIKLALGQIFPDGYDTWIWAMVALAGVNVAGMVGKRFTDIEYKRAGTSPVNVEAPSNVNVNQTANAPVQPSQPSTDRDL